MDRKIVDADSYAFTSPPVTAPCDAQSTRAPPGRGAWRPCGLSALDTRGSSCYKKFETTCWKCSCFGGQEATGSSVLSGRCHVLVKDFAECVAESAVEEHPDSCPIGREELHRYFTGTSTAPATFDYTSASGQEFRAALYTFQPSASALDAFAGDLLIDEVEVQLLRATNTSSLDSTASATMSTAASLRSWSHFSTPRSSFAGCIGVCPHFESLASVKPENWRPISLLPTSYNLYSGLLASRLSR
ncbi:hypothetical protein DD238_008370 [Peronospora effusa]|uniref:Uncharacterized protein n=1 Tax=Peronospora effusa TaxID=542832 RepID=A0A3M6VME2_9STRA|nr:hypothetical protein DD238_008370 [Peronospora effusa]